MFVTPAYGQETAPADQAAQPHGDAAAQPPAEGGAHTEVPHGEEAHGAFPPFDPATFPSQLLWLAITFGLFYLFLKKVVLPRIANILEVRHDRIAQDLDQAALMKSEADAAVAAYEQDLAEARAKANKIGQEARDKAKADAEAERKKIEASLDEKLSGAEASIAAIKASAMKEVGTIAEDTATAIIEQLVGKVSKADVAAAVKSVAG